MAQGSTVNKYELLLIGGSAGSLEAILHFLPALKGHEALAVVLVVHRRSGESFLANVLRDKSKWLVKEAEEKEAIVAGTIYIAPADYHLLIEKDKTFSLDFSEKINYSRPAIDVTFETAAEAYGRSVIALLLSGANSDGTEGLKKIKGNGGYTLVQQPGDAAVAYMPQFAIDHVRIHQVAPVAEISSIINELIA